MSKEIQLQANPASDQEQQNLDLITKLQSEVRELQHAFWEQSKLHDKTRAELMEALTNSGTEFLKHVGNHMAMSFGDEASLLRMSLVDAEADRTHWQVKAERYRDVLVNIATARVQQGTRAWELQQLAARILELAA